MMIEHSPTPWRIVPGEEIADANGLVLATLYDQANAAFVVRACNAHADLVVACRLASKHVQELRDAWERGALDEHDGKGGTRSNRNVRVDVVLRKALAKAGGGDA